MFFILSKVLLFLLSPALWIITLLIWSFLSRKEKRKRLLRVLSICLFLVFTNPLLFNILIRQWQAGLVSLPKGQKYSAVIMLGGVTMLDRNDHTFFGADADRFIQTTKLYHSGIVSHIAVAGGSSAIFNKRKPESEQIRGELLSQGIPPEAIIIENKSRNTFENATFIKMKLDSIKLPPPYILVTSALHVRRAEAVFKKAGVDVIVYPSAYKEINHPLAIDDFLPSTRLLFEWNVFMKEIVGYNVYKWSGKA